jgi:hypothetical protein
MGMIYKEGSNLENKASNGRLQKNGVVFAEADMNEVTVTVADELSHH